MLGIKDNEKILAKAEELRKEKKAEADKRQQEATKKKELEKVKASAEIPFHQRF